LVEIIVDKIACIGCGACVDACEPRVFELRGAELRGAKSTVVRPDDCIICFACTRICPANAIKIPFKYAPPT